MEEVEEAAVVEHKMKKNIIMGLLLLLSLIATGCSATGNAVIDNKVKITDDNLEINTSEITAQVKFFTYDYEGTEIKFFAVRGSDGKIRTAFDACDVCGGSKGYTQKGSDIVCNTCGKVFRIDDIGTENKGYGCWPSYLEHEIRDDKIIIQTQDLINQKYKFE